MAGRYKITQAAASLVEVMQEVLVRAVDSNSPEFAAAMCDTAQDAALLLLAIPPVVRPKELQVPHPLGAIPRLLRKCLHAFPDNFHAFAGNINAFA